jgi:hypothetical protein
MAISKGNPSLQVTLQVSIIPYSSDKFGIVMLNGADGSVISSRILSPIYIAPINPT